jgi:hypothetical protein
LDPTDEEPAMANPSTRNILEIVKETAKPKFHLSKLKLNPKSEA